MSQSTSGNGVPQLPAYDDMRKVFAKRTAQEFSAHLLPYLKPDFHILDMGCGPGSITVGLAQLVPQGHVVGIDVSSASLAQAREIAAAEQVHNVEFIEGNADNLESWFETRGELFDVIHMHQALFYLSTPVEKLKVMRKYLKEGGILSSRDSVDLRRYPDDETFQIEREIFGKMTASKGGLDRAGLRNHDWVHQAGFPWEKIKCGAAAFQWAGKQGRAETLAGLKGAYRAGVIAGGYASEEELDRRLRRHEEWEENEAGRIIGSDGWVLAWK